MSQSRIQNLRNLVARIGQQQLAYWQFFPGFADRLVTELGVYLGDTRCVALCCAEGEFSFEQGNYRHAGLEFEKGKFRVPLMFRIRNLSDDGDLQVRILVYFTLESGKVTAHLNGEPPITIDESDLTPLNEYIYQYLCKCFSECSWFEQRTSDYRCTAVGFLASSTNMP